MKTRDWTTILISKEARRRIYAALPDVDLEDRMCVIQAIILDAPDEMLVQVERVSNG